jgi:hypothetical protein
MNKAGKSVFVFGLYLVVLGLMLVAAPNFLLAASGLPTTSEVWIHVVGVLVLYLAFYLIQTARKGLTDFFRWTIYTRSTLVVFFAVFVLLSLAKPPLIVFGVVDLLGAIWTGLALRTAKTKTA